MNGYELINTIVTQKIGLRTSNIFMESQNSKYEGFMFSIDTTMFRSRTAKLTPKKMGYFAVFWEKDSAGTNQAYTYESSPDKLIINIIDNQQVGQFVFPKGILLKHRILKSDNKKGKMAMRVYPDWVTELNKTAYKTQQWQIPYFINLASTTEEIKRLYLD